jgi:hypothetical protein
MLLPHALIALTQIVPAPVKAGVKSRVMEVPPFAVTMVTPAGTVQL